MKVGSGSQPASDGHPFSPAGFGCGVSLWGLCLSPSQQQETGQPPPTLTGGSSGGPEPRARLQGRWAVGVLPTASSEKGGFGFCPGRRVSWS